MPVRALLRSRVSQITEVKMKNGVGTVAFFLLVLFLFMFFPVSCASDTAGDRLELFGRDSRIEIEGIVDGKEIKATLFSFPGAEDAEIRASVLFHSPASLNGINVTLLTSGKYSARLGDTAIDTEGLDGLIEPFIPLISPGEAYSIRRLDGCEEVRVCDENCDLTYVFEEGSGILKRVYGKYSERSIDMGIKSFSFDSVLPK